MVLKELRNSAIERWMGGDETQLVELILANDLNRAERELVSKIVSGDAPKRSRGRKRTSRKPLRAGLIRFWLRDVDGWQDEDAIHRAVEKALGVSTRRVRTIFDQLDAPTTKGQATMKLLLDLEITQRRVLLESGDWALINPLREADLKT